LLMIKYVSFRKAKIRYSDEGKGRAIVLLHGFPENLKIWEEFSAELSKHFRVIAIDLPGFGESESIGYVHTMEMMAQCVKEVMNNLNLRRYIIVGHSMGGYVSLAFAELYPDNPRGLVLFHSTSYKDSDEKKADRDRSIATVKKKAKSFINAFTANLFAKKRDPNLKKLRSFVSGTSTRAMVAALEGMKIRRDREIILRFAQYPVLFIFGKKDKIFNLEALLPQTETPAEKEVLILENAGHMGFYEANEETLNVVMKFAHRCFRKPVQ
jgi:pimeloyl-ACP methyl ester carboxylesterase